MTTWKLIVEEYGKIKRAEIEIAPLTLFVGDNNTGKSYLLALLWGIEKFGVEALIGEECGETDEAELLIDWIGEQIDIAMSNHYYEVSLETMADVLENFLNLQLQRQKNFLVRRIFNSKNIDIGKLSIKLGNLRDSILCFSVDEESVFLDMNDKKGHRFGISKEIMEDGSYREIDVVRSFLIQVIYCCVLNLDRDEDEMDACVYLPAARTGFMLTKDIINKAGRKNTFNIPEEKETITPFVRPINQFLDIMGDMSAEFVENTGNIRLAQELELEMTNGTVDISSMPNKEVQYVPVGSKKGIQLRLSSAVVTELSPLILMLKHKERIKRLYYEEPEMCLHPQLQYKMGKMLGRIVNSKIGLVITTHSDLIMQHINSMIKLAKREDCQEICKKMGYTKMDLLSQRDIKVYQFRAKSRGKTEVEELLCGEEGFCVPTFNDALEKIMSQAYEIQG